MFQSTKTYGHELGLSACFRQWRAKSHCNQLHGYPLAFKFTFQGEYLDETNWVVDFGSLKYIKGLLEDTFDHKLLVADDDPLKRTLFELERQGLATIRILPSVGCESFAYYIGEAVDVWLGDAGYKPRVQLVSVECREHKANSAIWFRPADL